MSGSTWKIEYGDGSSASGVVGTDDVNVGGLVIKNQVSVDISAVGFKMLTIHEGGRACSADLFGVCSRQR